MSPLLFTRRDLIAAALVLVFCAACFVATPAQAKWSRHRTRVEVKRAAKHYHVHSKWITRSAIDIIYTGAHESGGSTRARNGSCVGMLQFNSGWHLGKHLKRHKRKWHIKGDWRLSGKLSIWRMVKCYDDGGRAAIRKHWRATLGR